MKKITDKDFASCLLLGLTDKFVGRSTLRPSPFAPIFTNKSLSIVKMLGEAPFSFAPIFTHKSLSNAKISHFSLLVCCSRQVCWEKHPSPFAQIFTNKLLSIAKISRFLCLLLGLTDKFVGGELGRSTLHPHFYIQVIVDCIDTASCLLLGFIDTLLRSTLCHNEPRIER
jgi:hypothetical protein